MKLKCQIKLLTSSSKLKPPSKKAKRPQKKIKYLYSVLKPRRDSSLIDHHYAREAKIDHNYIRILLKRSISEFLEAYRGLANQMRETKLRLSHISESNLVLRVNLIKLETELLEGEVTSVISSGETLLLVIGAQEAREAKVLQARVKEMSDSWQSLLRYAEAKKSEASTSSRLENCLGLSDISDRLEMLSTAPPMTSSQGSISPPSINSPDSTPLSYNPIQNISSTSSSMTPSSVMSGISFEVNSQQPPSVSNGTFEESLPFQEDRSLPLGKTGSRSKHCVFDGVWRESSCSHSYQPPSYRGLQQPTRPPVRVSEKCYGAGQEENLYTGVQQRSLDHQIIHQDQVSYLSKSFKRAN